MKNVVRLLQLLTERFPTSPGRSHAVILPKDNAPEGALLQVCVWRGPGAVSFTLDVLDLEEEPETLVDVISAMMPSQASLEAAAYEHDPLTVHSDVVETMPGDNTSRPPKP